MLPPPLVLGTGQHRAALGDFSEEGAPGAWGLIPGERLGVIRRRRGEGRDGKGPRIRGQGVGRDQGEASHGGDGQELRWSALNPSQLG